MIKKLGVGNKVNIEFYGKLIGTLIPRPALFLTCHMTVKLNLDQKLAIFVDSHMFTTLQAPGCMLWITPPPPLHFVWWMKSN